MNTKLKLNNRLPFIIGFLSPMVYFLLLTTLGKLWSGYNPISTGMSEIGAVDSPYKDIINYFGFSLLGIGIMIFSYGYWKFFRKNKIMISASILVFISGLFLFLVGFTPCDSQCVDVTITGKLHSFISTVPAILMPIAAIISAHQLYLLLSKKVGSLSFYLGILSLSSGPIMFIPGIDAYSGIVQRLGIGFSMIWMMLVSVTILKKDSAKTNY